MYKGTFSQVLVAIAKYLGYDTRLFEVYAMAAPFAARRPNGDKWPTGTGSEHEKRILYAIAKMQQPKTIIDIGTRWGSCTLQFLTACDAHVVSIDIEQTIYGTRHKVGKYIPGGYKYDQIFTDAIPWLSATNIRPQLIFEDTAHDADTTQAIYTHALRILADGGIVMSHDAAHPKFKGAVLNGIKAAGIEPQVYLVEGDSCGLSIWRKPDAVQQQRWAKETAIMETLHDDAHVYETKIDSEAIKETPQRRKRKRKKTSKINAGGGQ